MDPDTKAPFSLKLSDENIMAERMLGLIKSKKAKRISESNGLAKYLRPKRGLGCQGNAEDASKAACESNFEHQSLKESLRKSVPTEECKLHKEGNGLITKFFPSKRLCTEVSNEGSDKLIEIPAAVGAIEPSDTLLLPQSMELPADESLRNPDATSPGEKSRAPEARDAPLEERKGNEVADASKGGLLSVKDITLANFGYTAPPKGMKARRSTQKSGS